jgi:hypothetical protein
MPAHREFSTATTATAADALAGKRNRKFRFIEPALWVADHWKEQKKALHRRAFFRFMSV